MNDSDRSNNDSVSNDKIHVVLVRPKYATNVGAVARAMSNMGAQRQILIAPVCEIDGVARKGAAGAQEKLTNLTIYQNWEEFYAHEPDGVRLAFTRRGGRNRPAKDFKQYLESLSASQLSGLNDNSVYLIFGPEDHGLATEDMELIHGLCTLPIYGDFFSLNLAQAVLLALYIYRSEFSSALPRQEHLGRGEKGREARKNKRGQAVSYFPDQTIRQWIEAIGFNITARRSSAYLTMKRLLLESYPNEREVQVLESVLQQNIRRLKAGASGGKSKLND